MPTLSSKPPSGVTRALACDIDCGHCAAQRLGIIAAVEVLLGNVIEGHLLGSDQVPGPHLGRLESHLPRDSVEYELEREANPGARDSTIGQDRTLVRRRRPGPASVGRKIVRAGQDARDLRGL